MPERQPAWSVRLSRPGAVVFAVMFALESFARAVLAVVIPAQAADLFLQARDISLLYTLVGLGGLVGSFSIPFFIRRFRRRWVYSAGLGLLIAAALLLSLGTVWGQAGGMFLRNFGTAAINIALALYVMDYIPRRDFVKSEPLKLLLSTASWTFGPIIGGWLYRYAPQGSAEAVSILSCATLLIYFWWLRMTENPAVAAATRPPPNPLAAIRRFVQQPRLRLGWFIPFSRSCWWAMFFTYPILYLIQAERTGAIPSGSGGFWGSVLVGAGNALLIFAPAIGRMAQHIGVRVTVIVAFLGAGALTLIAAGAYDHPYALVAFLFLAALPCVMLDAVGNIPFMRAVRPFERPQMTTVFRTYIDLSDLIPSAIYALLLSFFDLQAVFIAIGLYMLLSASVARYLPRSM